jgi:uncharacterized protein (DUF1778 family)
MGYPSSLVENQIADDILLEQLGVQFSLIATAHPISILGYVFVLEGYQAEAKTIYDLAERFSLPMEGFRTILYHLDIDKEHRKPIVELIDRYSPNEFLYGVMLKAAITNLVGWTKFYTKLVQDNN